ncbi:MAG TPA: NUDIX hydrolase [Patescibacteria group bacterium]|nr:NUDIX hydrolase [Patescibacteria group bacterium]
MATKAKILASKIVYQSTNFRINQEEIERDGHVFIKDIIEDTPIVVILPYTKKGEIYLGLEYRDAFGKQILNTIGGKVIAGKDLLESAKAELQEESGMKAATWKHVATWETAYIMRKKMSVFFATDLELGEQQLETDENIRMVKLSLADALQKIDTGEISVALDVAIILLFDKLQKEGKL